MKILPKLALCAVSIATALATTVSARADFPEKPVTIRVGFGAGGGVDAIARAAAIKISEALGQPITIENQPGAGGAVAVTSLKSAKPDGYTIVATTSTTITFDPHAQALAFALDDFDYIASFGAFPEALIALPTRGWKTFADTVAEAKGKEQGLTYASTTSVDRTVLGMISRKEGVKLDATPTKGGAEAVTQTLGGHVDFAYSSGSYYPQAKAGALNVLAVFGDERLSDFPDAPTLKELGYGISSLNTVLFLIPKATPDDVKKKLVDAFAAAAADPTLLDTLAKRNMGSLVPVGADVDKLIREQSEQFKAAIEATKAQ